MNTVNFSAKVYVFTSITIENVVVDCFDSNIIKSLSLYSKFVRKAGNYFYIKNDFEISDMTMNIDMNTYNEFRHS